MNAACFGRSQNSSPLKGEYNSKEMNKVAENDLSISKGKEM